MVPPSVRTLERTLDRLFDPPFAHVEVANKRELLHQQFMAHLKTPPKLQDLPRGEDPARETDKDKLRRAVGERFFLGRYAEVYVRQRADGSIVEIALRRGSGFHAFDAEALDAVARALAGHAVGGNPATALPACCGEDRNQLRAGRTPRDDGRPGEVRSLWRLEATAYVVYSATPEAQFDESTGKVEWVYPLEKRVDREVRLLAIY
jgi:hypothetical protein